MTLTAQAWLALAVLGLAMALLLFVPLGAFSIGAVSISLSRASVLTTVDLMTRDPALLKRRMRGGPTAEKEPTQRIIMLSYIARIHRSSCRTQLSTTASGGPQALLCRSYRKPSGGGRVLFHCSCVSRKHVYLGTIEVATGQKVVSTGPYAIVRHPMYASALLVLLGTPLALASYWGFLPLVVMMPFLIWRLLDEEQLLARDLRGYTEYQTRVRYRLVPFVW
jgi:protein-S-isoprenylcysteine O-methyltransferase Ste14